MHPLASQIDLAAQALAHFGLTPDGPLRLLKQRENSVYACESGGRSYVVRVHRRGYHTDAELACELDFVAALAAQGVAVPHFLRTLDGQGFCVVGSDAQAHQVDVQELIPNLGNFGDERTAVSGEAHLNPSDFSALGTLIAQVHEATERSQYTMAVPRDDWDLAGLVGPHYAWGDPLRIAELSAEDLDTLRAAIEQIRATLIAYGEPPHRFGPIHSDLTPENVLRTDDGLVLIDFDDFAAGWHLFDLATAIHAFTPHPRRAEYEAALFAGYQSIRPLDPIDFEVFPAILLARSLTYFGWAADRRGEDTAEWLVRAVLPHTLNMARAFLTSAPQNRTGAEHGESHSA